MQVVGFDCFGRPMVTKPTGLEELDYEDTLRHRYLGIHIGPPESHFLGGSDDITFGSDGGSEICKCWARWAWLEYWRQGDIAWREAYRTIGKICEHLSLPDFVREEIARIYANLRKQGKTMRVDIRKQLAKITWLACLIHRYPRSRRNIERGLRGIYRMSIGKIPKEFVKAANFRHIHFGVYRKNGKQYLRTWEMNRGKMTNDKILGKL